MDATESIGRLRKFVDAKRADHADDFVDAACLENSTTPAPLYASDIDAALKEIDRLTILAKEARDLAIQDAVSAAKDIMNGLDKPTPQLSETLWDVVYKIRALGRVK